MTYQYRIFPQRRGAFACTCQDDLAWNLKTQTERKNMNQRMRKCLALGMLALGIFTTRLMAEASVFVDLGTANVGSGLTCYSGVDGNNMPANVGGVDCRTSVNPVTDPYFYFGVDDSFVYGGNHRDVYVTVQYFDSGTDWITLQYDSLLGGAYKNAAFLFRQNTGTWKS